MTMHSLPEIELKISQTKEEIIQIYEEKPNKKELQDIDKNILNAMLDKLDSLVVIKYILENK